MNQLAKLLSLLAVVLMLSCSCSKRTTSISPVSDIQELPLGGMIYSLPRTALAVSIEVEFSHTFPGPYSEFAKRFLGIDGVPIEENSEWAIVSVGVGATNEADPNSLFAVLPGKEFNPNFLSLSSSGLVIPAGQPDFLPEEQPRLPLGVDIPSPPYKDLSPTPYISSQRTTHYSRVFQDSVFVRVPIHRDVVVERTKEEKAREAADFIFSLRKIRYELLSGDADFIAEGQAVEPVFAEISRLELEYLSLFIGQKYVKRSTQTFHFTPKGDSNESAILCRFSSARGLVSASDLSGSPVLIALANEHAWGGVEAIANLARESKGEVRTDAVYYRMPVPVAIKVTYGGQDYYQGRVKSFQHGPTLRVPASILSK